MHLPQREIMCRKSQTGCKKPSIAEVLQLHPLLGLFCQIVRQNIVAVMENSESQVKKSHGFMSTAPHCPSFLLWRWGIHLKHLHYSKIAMVGHLFSKRPSFHTKLTGMDFMWGRIRLFFRKGLLLDQTADGRTKKLSSVCLRKISVL